MQAFPGQVNTATTAGGQTSGPVLIHFDPYYVRTLPGMLKVGQMLLNILGFICIQISHINSHSRCGWYSSVSMAAFWATSILLACYQFHVVEKFQKIPWLKIEFIYCAIITACYLLAASLVAALASTSESLGVAALFGFLAMCVYGFDAWVKFKAWKSGDCPQGQRPSSKPVSTVGSPAGY
ncbi:CKLF-like MARVEL transmembrane domain-containing protein 4 [Phymastichus coffea]|uniref:CKLF-like MARVEL transmembrane domain-containing protein 4 n=1 Tax=Phymastichus coffea TaxID=108790 RepID=UPI00273B93B0|nr:CKLF-like MARVEL transmembrane domain-containing protein 4 [Phymastichus coffea]XP_058802034.1 CKLF-like MARVEL transmembrane domain-containing protein 4 [Phymastichus coffea]